MYSAYKRLYHDSNKTTILKCSSASDQFSSNTSRGNGDLTYPIALIMADEVALAGGKAHAKNEDYYLRTNNYYFTMTPSYFYAANAHALIYRVNPTGDLDQWCRVIALYGVRPVINIRSDVLIQEGDGTSENPFILQLA